MNNAYRIKFIKCSSNALLSMQISQLLGLVERGQLTTTKYQQDGQHFDSVSS